MHTPVVTRQNTCESNKVAKHKRAVAQDILSREVAAPRTLHTDGTNVVRSLKCCVIVGTFVDYNYVLLWEHLWIIIIMRYCVVVIIFLFYYQITM